jgi:ectoine hydroxylase-related dioxygenase (phytanoyl-CoA dioxygenase family)
LPIVAPSEVERAADLFHRDGFVVVADALSSDQLARMRAATERALAAMLEADPTCAAGGGAGGLPHRYSFGSSSASRHMLHVDEWVDLVDLPTTTPILTAIFGSPNYVLFGGGGDVALPGAIEYQGLHADNVWTEPHDPTGRTSIRDLPVPAVTINFAMVDFTTENGPTRQIPGSQTWRHPIPNLLDEPEWMKLSTLCPVPAGSAIFRDMRAWHGGTPNLSREVRAAPNMEYFAPWFRSEALIRSMPYEQWKRLSPHGRRIARYVALAKGETVIGAGYIHPRAKAREAFREQQLAEMDAEAAAEYRQRL